MTRIPSSVNRLSVLMIVVIVLTVTGSASVFVSVPTTATADSTPTIGLEAERSGSYNLTYEVSDGETVVSSGSYTGLAGSFSNTTDLDDITLTADEYTVTAQIEQNGDVLEQTTASFSVSSIAAVRPFRVTADTIDDCPFGSAGRYGQCKVFGNSSMTEQETTRTIGSQQQDVKHYQTSFMIDGERYYASAVDLTGTGQYDWIWMDDDPNLYEDTETGNSSMGFSRRGDTVISFTRDGTQYDVRAGYISTTGIVLYTAPTDDEIPIRPGDGVAYTGMTLDADEAPAAGESLSTQLSAIGEDSMDAFGEVTSDGLGIIEPQTAADLAAGSYRIQFGDFTSVVERVRAFNIEYSISDGSGQTTSTFEPGETMVLEAYPVVAGDELSADAITATITRPDGERASVTFSDNTAEWTIPDDMSGTGTVSIEVTAGSGSTQTVSTDFEVKPFDVITIPLRTTEYGLQQTQGFGPSNTGYLFVGAVKLGTAGGINDLQQAEFFPLDNPNTSTDECHDNIGDLSGQLGSDDTDITISQVTNLTASGVLSPEASVEMPESFLRQCLIEVETPEQTGLFSGTIPATRANTSTSVGGDVSFSVSRFRVDGRVTNPGQTRRSWAIPTDGIVGVRPEVTKLRTQEQLAPSNITDMSVIELSDGVDVRNETFHDATTTNGPLLTFNAPNETGDYRVRFSVFINTTNATGQYETTQATGNAYFHTKAFLLRSTTEGAQSGDRFDIRPDEAVNMTVFAETLDGSAKEGVSIDITDIRNRQTGQDYTDTVTESGGPTDSSGESIIQLGYDDTWADGDYSIQFEGQDSAGNTDNGYGFFRVDRYRTNLDQPNGTRLTQGKTAWLRTRMLKTADDQHIDHSIDIGESELIYRGSGDLRTRESIPMDDLVIGEPSTGVDQHGPYRQFKLNTSTLDAGEYSLAVQASTDDQEEQAHGYFRLLPFDMTIEQAEDSHEFGPGTNITYLINMSQQRDFTVAVDSVSTWTGEGNEEYDGTALRSGSVEQSYSGVSEAYYNITVPQSAEEGYYSGSLTVSAEGSTVSDRISFNVALFSVGVPSNTAIGIDGEALENTTSIAMDRYDSCSEGLSTHGLSFDGTAPSGTCSVAAGVVLGESDLDDPPQYNLLRVNETDDLYISRNDTFNETDDIATPIGETATSGEDARGLTWRYDDFGQSYGGYEVTLTATNGFISGVIAPSGTAYVGGYNGPITTDERYLRADINGDGDQDDTLYLIGEKTGSSYETIHLSMDKDFTTETASLDATGQTASFGGPTLYHGGLWPAQYHDREMVLYAMNGETDSAPALQRRPKENYTVAVQATQPDGSPIQGEPVSIGSFEQEYNNGTVAELESPAVDATTNNDGVAFVEVNMTNHDPSTSDLGQYQFQPQLTVDGTTKAIDQWRAPEVTVEVFGVTESAYRGFETTVMEYTGSAADVQDQTEMDGLPESESDTYKINRVDETDLDADGCVDADLDGWCNETISIVMYDDQYGQQLSGTNISQLIIDDDRDVTYTDETRTEREVIYDDDLHLNTSTIEERTLFDFALFNETTDILEVYRNTYDPVAEEDLHLAVKVSDVFSQAVKEDATVEIDQIRIDDEIYQAAEPITATTNSEGTALLSLEPEQFLDDQRWPASFVRFEGTITKGGQSQSITIFESFVNRTEG